MIGAPVSLERRSGGGWARVAGTKTNGRGFYIVRARGRGHVQGDRARERLHGDEQSAPRRALGGVPEARLEDFGSGLAPAGDGWFVVNVRDAQWMTAENGEKKPPGSDCRFESREFSFPQLGIKIRVLEPGQPNGLYHSESAGGVPRAVRGVQAARRG